MLNNNGYIRGEYAVIGKTAFAGTKLSDYKLDNDEFTKHYLTTKEYVDSKIKVNSLFSVKSGYTHQIINGKITALSTNSDFDGKPITKTESLISSGGYIIKNDEGEYSVGIIEDNTGKVGYEEELELGQQLYSELDNQIYTLIEYGSPATKILVPETITTTISNSNNNDIITFDKLFNDTVYHKLTISPLDLSTTTTHTVSLTIPTTTTNPSNYTSYIEYMLKNNMEESVGKVISLSSYSGIVKSDINALLFEIVETIEETEHIYYTAQISTKENNVEVIDTITLTYSSGTTPPYNIVNNKTTINSTQTKTYYLIDYYNKNVVKCSLTSSGGTSPAEAAVSIDLSPSTTTIPNEYVKDLNLLAELNISKSLTSGSESYTITIRALSSPEAQHITNWVIETPLILNTYKQ